MSDTKAKPKVEPEINKYKVYLKHRVEPVYVTAHRMSAPSVNQPWITFYNPRAEDAAQGDDGPEVARFHYDETQGIVVNPTGL